MFICFSSQSLCLLDNKLHGTVKTATFIMVPDPIRAFTRNNVSNLDTSTLTNHAFMAISVLYASKSLGGTVFYALKCYCHVAIRK